MSTTATTTMDGPSLNSRQARWIEVLARCGYAAKGVVYIIIGCLALQVAFGNGGETSGPKGALSQIAGEPFGQFLLVMVGIGLIGYSLWRFVQAWADPEYKGSDAKGIAKRVGYACSGVVYALLAVEAVRIAFMSGGGSGGNSAEHWTATLMSQPFGQLLVGGIGAAIIGTGLYQLYRAWTAEFKKMLKSGQMSLTELIWSERIGRAGFAARGIVYLIIGSFLLIAAIRTNPDHAMGMGQALQYLSQQSYGPWLLGLVAAGLVAYGVFSSIILSRYRKILVKEAIAS